MASSAPDPCQTARARPDGRPIRVLQVASRLAIGGPALHVITLTDRLRRLGYDVEVVRGCEEPREGTLDALADRHGVDPITIPSIRRTPRPRDLWAIARLWWLIRRRRPDVLHTHMAKAGTVGRLAAVAAGGRRPPVVLHTFHGHVFRGYFRPRVTRAFVSIERLLARLSTRLLAVSEEVRVDLAAFGVAPLERIETVHLGIDLDDLDSTDADRAAARAAVRDEFGIGADDVVVAIAARLVPVKRIDRLLRIAIALGDVERLRVLVAGGGELQDELPRSAAAIALGERVCWLGFRQDIRAIYAAADIVVLTSDTEGTPTSLIEAAACGVPVVATDVGGVRTVVEDGVTGFVVPAADERAFARRVRELAADQGLRTRLGAAARDRARREFDIERMVGEIDEIYRRLLSEQGAQGAVELDG